ncbi:hypothetical protein WMY93_026744 [Mugilogobius chulae]|uniref:Ig-like domain-containing protein n=1 Tax=Mugilogobius chulae TaxID=88201 RepID=A0AAW0N2W0_9GOBI
MRAPLKLLCPGTVHTCGQERVKIKKEDSVICIEEASAGILGGDWSVNVPSQICTTVGSSAILPCSYDFPESKDGHQVEVKSEMWCLGNGRCVTPRYVYHSAGILLKSSFQGRVKYLGTLGSKNCSLKISGLEESDSGTYVFYLITNHTTEKMPAQRGIQLLVSGSPSVVSVLAGPSSVIMEGESVSLSCCSPGLSSEVLWFKNSSSGPQHNGPDFAVFIDPPRNTAISLSSSKDRSVAIVTLTCRSEANPPVLTYSWYKGAACDSGADTSFHKSLQSYGLVTEGDLTMSKINISSDSSEVHCCVARNRHGSQKSSLSSSSGVQMVLLGVTIAVVLAMIAIAAFMIIRRKKSSRNQSYALAATSSAEP